MKCFLFLVALMSSCLAYAEEPLMMNYWRKGEVALREQHYEEAVYYYTLSIESASAETQAEKYYDIFLDRAFAFQKLGKMDEALADYQVISNAYGENINYPLWLAHYVRALNEKKNILMQLNQYSDQLPIYLVRASERDVQNERDAVNRELNQVNRELYNLGREALNFNPGEVAHHAIQAGQHGYNAWQHSREANRLERDSTSGRGLEPAERARDRD